MVRRAKRVLSEEGQRVSKEPAADMAAINHKADTATVFWLILATCCLTVMSVVLFLIVVANPSFGLTQRVIAGLASLIFLTLSVKAFHKSIDNHAKRYFSNLYCSGERTPEVSWEYTLEQWTPYARRSCFRTKSIMIVGLYAITGVLIADSLLSGEYGVALLVFWLSYYATLFYLQLFHKDNTVKRQAYLHSKSPTLDIYSQGVVISNKYYVPFHTRFVLSREVSVIELHGMHYLQFYVTYVDADADNGVSLQRYPIPVGKEQEAKGYVKS